MPSFTPLPGSTLRIGVPMPVALRDVSGKLLVPRGGMLETELQLKQLMSRGVYVDEIDSELLRKAVHGKLQHMVQQDQLIGRIATAQPDAQDIASAAAPPPAAPRRVADPVAAWGDRILRVSALLRDPAPADFIARLQRVEQEALDLLNGDADDTLLTLIQTATTDTRQYSATHALLVMVVCELAARHLPGWSADWRGSMRRAALTMNLAMTALQDQLSQQDQALSTTQREAVNTHAARGAAQLRGFGVADERWLEAVERHHDAPGGPLDEQPPALQIARLVQRADIFAARLSPRKRRHGLSATAAAKAAYLDEQQKADEAGAAIIKALGIYPPGSFVKLANGEVAVVLRRGRRANEPMVASVVGRNGIALGDPAVRDTRHKGHEIASGVLPHEVKVRLNLLRLLQLA